MKARETGAAKPRRGWGIGWVDPEEEHRGDIEVVISQRFGWAVLGVVFGALLTMLVWWMGSREPSAEEVTAAHPDNQTYLIWNRYYEENGRRVERLMIKRPEAWPTADAPQGIIAQGIEEGAWGIVALRKDGEQPAN